MEGDDQDETRRKSSGDQRANQGIRMTGYAWIGNEGGRTPAWNDAQALETKHLVNSELSGNLIIESARVQAQKKTEMRRSRRKCS